MKITIILPFMNVPLFAHVISSSVNFMLWKEWSNETSKNLHLLSNQQDAKGMAYLQQKKFSVENWWSNTLERWFELLMFLNVFKGIKMKEERTIIFWKWESIMQMWPFAHVLMQQCTGMNLGLLTILVIQIVLLKLYGSSMSLSLIDTIFFFHTPPSSCSQANNSWKRGDYLSLWWVEGTIKLCTLSMWLWTLLWICSVFIVLCLSQISFLSAVIWHLVIINEQTGRKGIEERFWWGRWW